MAWCAIRSADRGQVLGNGIAPGVLRGSLVIEARMPVAKRPQPLLSFRRAGKQAMTLSVMVIPGGGLSLVLEKCGNLAHCAVSYSEAGRTDILRLTYSWDATLGKARLAVERSDKDQFVTVPVSGRAFPSGADLAALMEEGDNLLLCPEVLYLAVSDRIEPVGPMPSLRADTPVATPDGYRPIQDIRRGDTVYTSSGDLVPVLHSTSRTVPALGGFQPVRVRAPYFGLQTDIVVAPFQHLVLTGSDVDYLFGQEAVLLPVRHLVDGSAARRESGTVLVQYFQLLLPGHEALLAAGAAAESLYIGRIRRKKSDLAASLLAGQDRSRLPEHGKSVYPVLRAYDALVLADQRAA